ncbi:MAG TPA: molybdenum ABC transporter ATP-binding protein [Gammaproteobacteria bacterium]|nr:molybdenum ABC transporter ATP-binding protein [Gammaproteobacteria bacterium]
MLTFRFQLRQGGFDLDAQGVLPAQGRSVIFGPSGAGKTTLLRLMAGLERGAQARIAYGDELWEDREQGVRIPPHRRRIGLVFQHPVFMPGCTVEQALRYGWRRRLPAERRGAFAAAAERFGLSAQLQRRVVTLSGGERQRVALLRALLAAPRLLLLDEPFSGIDTELRATLLHALEALHAAEALPMIYVTHSAEEAVRFADHLLLLEAGRVRALGPADMLAADISLPLARRPDAVVAINTKFVQHDANDGVSLLAFSDGELWVTASRPAAPGARLRVLVHARDVSLARTRPQASSILNVMPARVVALAELPDAAVVVSLRIGNTPLLARVSRRSARELELQPGCAVYAQVKGVALQNP